MSARLALLAGTIGCLIHALPADATLTLTPAGIADGFSFTTFITGDGDGYPVLTAVEAASGTVLVGSDSHNAIYRFTDTDNQTLADALSVYATPGDPVLASVGGRTYAAITFGGPYLAIRPNGSTADVRALSPRQFANLGLWGNPVTGHLLSSSSGGIVDINPATGTTQFVEITHDVDGITVSPDGSTVYGAAPEIDHILGWNIASGANFRFRRHLRSNRPHRWACRPIRPMFHVRRSGCEQQ